MQPDLFVVHPDEANRDWIGMTRLDLVVEVLSPSSLRADRVVKRRTYRHHGVRTYWILDDDAKLVEGWHPEHERPDLEHPGDRARASDFAG